MENLDQTSDNLDPASVGATATEVALNPGTSTDSGSIAKSWKSSVRTDLKDSPLLQKFEDTPEGLNKALESHANLEKLLGHDKVPIPKDINDVEGWNRFSKALGIPDKATGYGLPDPSYPEEMKGMAIDKNKFADIVHAHKLTPAQANGLWKAYNDVNVEAYGKAMEAHKTKLNETVTKLKSEWGDAYNTNIELGQTVINKFAPDQETNDFLTNAMTQDPRAIKFLAKIGEQFAENKVGEFQIKRFSLAPEEAQNEINKMVKDLEGTYMNTTNKFTDAEHEAAVARVNTLRASINRAKG